MAATISTCHSRRGSVRCSVSSGLPLRTSVRLYSREDTPSRWETWRPRFYPGSTAILDRWFNRQARRLAILPRAAAPNSLGEPEGLLSGRVGPERIIAAEHSRFNHFHTFARDCCIASPATNHEELG